LEKESRGENIMKKHVRFFAALMAMTMMLTGCQSGNATADLSATRTEDVVAADIAQEQDDAEVDAENKEEAAKENDMMIVELKAKYAAAETVTYQDAMHLLPEDHNLYLKMYQRMFLPVMYIPTLRSIPIQN
jgi:ABC-type glycerol-3-phosphate transport system substrate-binding protein